MRALSFVVKSISLVLFWIACAAAVCIVFVTVFDVIMRRSGHPTDFAIEVVCLLAGVVIAFALPATSLNNDHVIMEFIEKKLSENWLKVAHIISKCVGITIFVIIGMSTFKYGNLVRVSGQCSAILQIPEFPLVYALSLGCFVECLVLFYMLLGNIYPGERQ